MAYEHIPTRQLREMSWDALERIDHLNEEIMAERARLGAVPGQPAIVNEHSELWLLTQRLADAWAEYRPLHEAYYQRVIAEDDANQ